MKRTLTSLFGLLLLQGFVALHAQKVNFDYVTNIGGPGAQTSAGDVYKARTLAVDKQGFVYNAGKINDGEVEFDVLRGGKKLKSDGGRHYIAKYDSVQNLIWVKQYGDQTSTSQTQAVAVDGSGNIYLAGYYISYFNVNPSGTPKWVNTQGSTDMFIIKLDSDGNYLWSKEVGGTSSDYIYGMTVDEEGNVFATGFVSGDGEVVLSPGVPGAVIPKRSCFIWKLNSGGDFVWVKTWKDPVGSPVGRDIALDPDGNIFVTGNFSNRNTDFNPGTRPQDTFFLSSTGNMDIFVTKLDKSGEFQWARSFGGQHQDQGFSIAVDEAGAVYTTGIFADVADFNPWGSSFRLTSMNPPSGPSTNNMEVFISKIDADGNFVWARKLNGPGSNWGYSVAAGKGKAKGVYVTGVFRDHSEFYAGKDTFTMNALYGSSGTAFLIKLDTAGTFEWSYATGGVASGTVVVDEQGNVFTAGWVFGSSVDFDPDPTKTHIVPGKGLIDGYIHKMKWCQLTDTIVEVSCGTFTYLGKEYTKTGRYAIPDPTGCDDSSKIIIDLTIYRLDPVITIDEKTLSTALPYTTYQWIKDGALIQGATSRQYTVTSNGDYQVIVTNETGCVDTSDVYKVTNAETGIRSAMAGAINVYPNPATTLIHVAGLEEVDLYISNAEGRVLKQALRSNKIEVSGLANGLYFLKIYDRQGILLRTEKISKH